MSMLQDWASSPSTGAYQSHEVMEVFRQAVEQSIWMPFAKRVSISSGQAVTVPIRGRLAEPSSSLLQESQSIPLDKLNITAKTISLYERGRGAQISRKNINRSPIDLLQEHKLAIAEQMQLDMDTVLKAGFTAGQLKYVPTGAASYNLATNGTAGAAALSNVNFYHIRKMRDLAFRTYLMPKNMDGSFSFVVSTAGVRGILDDPEFLEINSPQNRSQFEGNLCGKIADVKIFEDNHSLSDSKGTNSDVGEGVFIARDSVYYAILSQPSIHYDASDSTATDFGRFVNLAWHGDWGCGTSTDSASAGLVRLIHVTSS